MSQTRKLLLLLGDLIALYGSLALTLLLRYPLQDFKARFDDHLFTFSALFIAWVGVFWLFDFYRQRSFVNYNALANRLMGAVGTAVIGSVILFYLFEEFFLLTPKTNLALFAVIVLILEYGYRSLVLTVSRFRPEAAVVVGSSPEIKELVEFLERHPHAGCAAAAWIEDITPVSFTELRSTLERVHANTIIIQPSLTNDPAAIRALYDLLPLGVNIINFPDFYELVFERVPLDELEEGWFIEHVTTRRPGYDRAKRLVDFVLSILLFVSLLPLSILIAILIKLTSKGPAVFAQDRTGKNNRVFRLFKFRTMNTWTGGNDGTPAWTEEHDSRITGFGKVLRFTHLDELPQLWNIIRGDISFTGPRPERVEIVKQYNSLPYYDIRHVITPGLTGWAQINYKPSASIEEGREKLKYDIYYIKHRSFLLDMAIILKTAKYVFTRAGG
jgi:exopolysaccharide biosynthesis polyprenyl glycosylphosphotransferase